MQPPNLPFFVVPKYSQMNAPTQTPENIEFTDLNLYLEMGNDAIRSGNVTECLRWYSKGLNMARELKNAQKEREFSNLIITLI